MSDDEYENVGMNPRFVYVPKEGDIDVLANRLLWKEVVQEGEGPFKPEYGMRATIHYVGTVLQSGPGAGGEVYEDTKLYGEPLEVIIGDRGVLQALSYGLPTMKKGEKAVFISDPKYGFGNAIRHKIPRRSTIKLEVELIDWVDNLGMEGSGRERNPQIIRERIALPISKDDFPTDGAFLRVSWEGLHDGRVFDTGKSVEYFFGDEDLLDVTFPRGFKQSLRMFRSQEKSLLKFDPFYAFGEEGCPKFDLPPNSPVEYIFELHYFLNIDDEKKLLDENIYVCDQLSKIGAKLYDVGETDRAVGKFQGILKMLDTTYVANDPIVESRSKEIADLLANAHLSLGKCLLTKTEDKKSLDEAIEHTDKALEEDPNWVEAWLNRGRIHLTPVLANPQEALKCFSKAKELSPDNSEVIAEYDNCQEKLRERKEKEAELAKRMLGIKV